MKASSLWVGLLLLCAVGAGCSVPPDNTEAAARDIVERYYQLIDQGRLVEAANLYPEESRDEWKDFLNRTRAELGPLKAYHIDSMETHTVYSGRFYMAIVDTEYEKGTATETVTLKTAVGQDDLSLVGHKIERDRQD